MAVPFILCFCVSIALCIKYIDSFETFANAVAVSLTVGFAWFALAWCYIHFLWIKPSRHLLLGIQQVVNSQAECDIPVPEIFHIFGDIRTVIGKFGTGKKSWNR